MKLNEKILYYRKAAKLSQEELAAQVGVSRQAVSKWEKGGAPDVELLPALADRLGVTIDALFGREGGAVEDMEGTLIRWLISLPEGQRISELCRLAWSSSRAIMNHCMDTVTMPELKYSEGCTVRVGGEDVLLRVAVDIKEGLLFGVGSEELSFMSIWPRPEKGYEAYFASMDEYRTLFAVLSRPGCLELLEYLNSQTSRLYVPEALAAALQMPQQEVETILQALLALHVMHKKELQLADGLTSAYTLFQGATLVPFLYMARCMMQYGQNLVNIGDGDAAPLLDGGGQNDKKEKKDEKK